MDGVQSDAGLCSDAGAAVLCVDESSLHWGPSYCVYSPCLWWVLLSVGCLAIHCLEVVFIWLSVIVCLVCILTVSCLCLCRLFVFIWVSVVVCLVGVYLDCQLFVFIWVSMVVCLVGVYLDCQLFVFMWLSMVVSCLSWLSVVCLCDCQWLLRVYLDCHLFMFIWLSTIVWCFSWLSVLCVYVTVDGCLYGD